MSDVGQRERETQNRVVRFFRDDLGYEYLGNWEARPNNSNIEEPLLRQWLSAQGVSTKLIDKAIRVLDAAKTLGGGKDLYQANKEVYSLLRYGAKVSPDIGEHNQTVLFIDWKHPENNHFAIAEEVTVGGHWTKRPDIVLYINGIAVGVIELKRSTVNVSQGIRQNLSSQRKEFIRSFFPTVQLVMAGNDVEGLRYATIDTSEKYWLSWKEDSTIDNPLDRALSQLCSKERLLEIVHDFTVFDEGVKKTARHNQYFGVKAAQQRVKDHEGGIIWHTQGSGKSLTMVWLAKWIRENTPDGRVLIITDRTELDEQIEGVFEGVDEEIYRTRSGGDLLAKLNATDPWLMCSLVHKFGVSDQDSVDDYIKELERDLPRDFAAKGNLFVFVDECHRTQSGKLHQAMKQVLPQAMFIGFTGTPLLKTDKQRSIETFGSYIHTYKFDEAVRDGVVLDLRYEARDINQVLTSPGKVDDWFEAKTRGLTDLAKAELKQKWGTMQKVLSSRSRAEKIVADVLLDMERKERLANGRGNAILVSSSIYQACKFFEMFSGAGLKGKCAIVTSYAPSAADIKGEDSGEGLSEKIKQYEIYRRMLADHFGESEDTAMGKVSQFEDQVKDQFVHHPGQMRLLIVVDKLLTGFDAPAATYLYIDKEMRDHGLFQAICRVNRLDGDDKDYGYIVDYKDLFNSVEGAYTDYTSGALDGYDSDDVAGLLENRLEKSREDLEGALETVRTLCEHVGPEKTRLAYQRYFCASPAGDKDSLKDNEPKRLALYKAVSSLVRAYANIANEMPEAGYSAVEIDKIKAEVKHYEQVREEVKLGAGENLDMKQYEPAMRYLLDTYIRADESETVSAFENQSLIDLIAKKGADAINDLPAGLKSDPEAVAETITNNIRKVIIDEQPINPRYYDRMSELLDDLIEERQRRALEYKEYLAKLVQLAQDVKEPEKTSNYPAAMDTRAKQALYDNLDRDADLAARIDTAVRYTKKDSWRGHRLREREVRNAIHKELAGNGSIRVDEIFELVSMQDEY